MSLRNYHATQGQGRWETATFIISSGCLSLPHSLAPRSFRQPACPMYLWPPSLANHISFFSLCWEAFLSSGLSGGLNKYLPQAPLWGQTETARWNSQRRLPQGLLCHHVTCHQPPATWLLSGLQQWQGTAFIGIARGRLSWETLEQKKGRCAHHRLPWLNAQPLFYSCGYPLTSLGKTISSGAQKTGN